MPVSLSSPGNHIAHIPVRYDMANGLSACIQRNPGTATVSVHCEIQIGAAHEPPEKAGLALLTSSALICGTRDRTFAQIVQAIDQAGWGIETDSDFHRTRLSSTVLIEDLPHLLDQIADLLIFPIFPQQEVEHLRQQFLESLRESEQEAFIQVSHMIRAALFPVHHPYHRLPSGTFATVERLTCDDLAAFHRCYQPKNATIAIVGDVDPRTVIGELERVFIGWNPKHVPLGANMPPAPSLSNIQRHIKPIDGAIQSVIMWAVQGPRRCDPDYYAALVANAILSRVGFGGRLGNLVRKELGLAYGIFSDLDADLEAGPWSILTHVHPHTVEQATEAILQVIEQLGQMGPTEQEIDNAKTHLISRHVLGLESNDGIAAMLLAIERYQLGADYIRRYPAIIRDVSRDEVVAVIHRYLYAKPYVLAIAGALERHLTEE